MDSDERTTLEQELIPRRYWGCTWETFKIERAFPVPVKVLKSWQGEGEPICCICGPAGTGKTHMAVATVLRWIAARGYGARFLVVPEWLQEIKGGFGSGDSFTLLHRAQSSSTKLLVLDDLGAELATDWVRDTVYSVVNHRYNELLPTIVTTNLTLAEISQNYHDRLASRLASGLVVNTKTLPDRRLEEKK